MALVRQGLDRRAWLHFPEAIRKMHNCAGLVKDIEQIHQIVTNSRQLKPAHYATLTPSPSIGMRYLPESSRATQFSQYNKRSCQLKPVHIILFHKQLLPRRFLYWKCAFPALELSFPYKETTVPQAGNWYLTYMIGVT